MTDKQKAAVEKYIAEVDKLIKTNKTEHPFRPALKDLLSELTGLTVINEPQRQECGAPDFGIEKNGLYVMYLETKKPGAHDLVGKKVNKDQFDRYKADIATIIFSDYLDFHFYQNEQPVGDVRIAEWDKNKDKVTGKSENFEKFVNMISEFASKDPGKITTASRLAVLMARKARMLQRVAAKYLKEPEAKGKALDKMMTNFRKVLMPEVEIDDKFKDEFSDVFAQTLTYGMFVARLNDPTPEDFSRDEARKLIPKSNPFLKELFEKEFEANLETIIDDLVSLFRAVDVEKVMEGYGTAKGKASDPIVHFYEDFLREYDAGLKKDRGVWYTPIQIVRFMVSAVDWALTKHFGLKDGLATDSKIKIKTEKGEKEMHRVQILDPATGTGTFLAETIRQIRKKFDSDPGLWKKEYVAENLLPRLNGFEILMASYTIAHVKLDYALRDTLRDTLSDTEATLPEDKRFRVFLTNSLREFRSSEIEYESALVDEQRGADEVKRDTPVMVVMANPPYLRASQNQSKWTEWINTLVDEYQVEPGGKQKLKEPKNWLKDDYVKFIRLAEYYVEDKKNGCGIVAYITNHGFLDNPTFRGMRWHLMRTFDEIWTLNLHGNVKKKEVPPDGGKDENVFSIQEGVTITLMVKKEREAGAPPKPDARVFYADLWGSREKKLEKLNTASMESIEWQELSPSGKFLFFVPFNPENEAEWNAGFAIKELMPRNSTGVFTLGDPFAVAHDRNTLEERARIINAGNLTEGEITTRFSLKKNYASFIKKHLPIPETESITDYAYHPFDTRWINYSPKTIWRPRTRVMVNFSRGENLALIVGRQGQVVGPGEWNLAFVTDRIVDLNVFYRGGGQVFPLWLYEENMGTMEKVANLEPTIVGKIAGKIGREPKPEEIVGYIYGVLYTPHYRKKFSEFLKTDFPRIPYPKDAAHFERVAEAGRALIDTHLMRDAAPGLAEPLAKSPVGDGCKVDKVRFADGKVYINAEQYFDNVPESLWEMTIGGYQPAQKWLKDRKDRELDIDDIRHYKRLIVALARTAEAAEKLDAIAAE